MAQASLCAKAGEIQEIASEDPIAAATLQALWFLQQTNEIIEGVRKLGLTFKKKHSTIF